MMRTPWHYAIALLAVTAPTFAVASPTPNPPRPWLEANVEKGRKLASQKVESGTPAEKKWQTDVKLVIDDILDWDELTRLALGRHWAERSEPEKKEFGALLREMIEASYLTKIQLATRGEVKKPQKVDIEWVDDKVTGKTAVSSARFKADKTTAVLEFKLRWNQDRWRVYDVAIDDVSTVRTYRSQFGKIVAKEGFAGLMTRIRKKTEDIRTGRASLSPVKAGAAD